MVSSNSQVQLMMIQMIKICDDCDDEFADNDEQSQAIWCALYKQSPGDEGWQVEQSPSLPQSTMIIIIIRITIIMIILRCLV